MTLFVKAAVFIFGAGFVVVFGLPLEVRFVAVFFSSSCATVFRDFLSCVRFFLPLLHVCTSFFSHVERTPIY